MACLPAPPYPGPMTKKSQLEDYSSSTPGLLVNSGDWANLCAEAEGCLPP